MQKVRTQTIKSICESNKKRLNNRPQVDSSTPYNTSSRSMLPREANRWINSNTDMDAIIIITTTVYGRIKWVTHSLIVFGIWDDTKKLNHTKPKKNHKAENANTNQLTQQMCIGTNDGEEWSNALLEHKRSVHNRWQHTAVRSRCRPSPGIQVTCDYWFGRLLLLSVISFSTA